MNRIFFIIMPLLYCSASFANEVTVYRWVDENNVVHYDQHEPIKEDYSEVTIETSYSPVQAPLKEKNIGESSANQSNQIAQASRVKCKNAQVNLKTLTEFSKVEVTEKDGRTRTLSDKERIQRLKTSQKEVELYCQNN